MSLDVITSNADVVVSTVLEVGVPDTTTMVDTSTTKVAKVIPNSFVLSSGGIYDGRLDGSIPLWLLDAIAIGVANGTLDYDNILSDLRASLDSLTRGVNQNIAQIENTNLSMSSLETSIVSRLNGNDAAILNLDTTSVTEERAQAISTTAIQSTFGVDASAYVGNIVSTYANANLATAASVELLVAEYGGLSVSITSMEEVYAGVYQEWDGVGAPMIGMFKFVGDIQYQYLGGLLGENNDGWVRTDASAATIANTAYIDANNALVALADLEEARDGNVVVYYLTTIVAATGMAYGDYLVDIDSWDGSNYIVYRYQNSTGGSSGTLSWYANIGETAKSLSAGYRAQVLAGTAQSTADGKIKTWYQISAPVLTTNDIGDIWIDTDNANKLKVWSGAAWVDQTSTQGTQAAADIVVANGLLADIASDSKLTPVEKSSVKLQWDAIVSEYTAITSRATATGITYATYTTTYNALSTYITPLLSSMNTTSDIVGTTFRTKFSDYFSAKLTLLNLLDATDSRTGALLNANEATPPTATGIGDIWVVTDRWYTASTGTTVSAIEYEAVVPATVPVTYYPRYGKATKRWSGTAWVLLSNGSTTLTNITWAAGASKLITAPDGSVTGWAFGDGSATQSEFKIKAQNFSISDGVTGYTPFSIVGSDIQFDGLVSFTNVTDAPAIPTSIGELFNDTGFITIAGVPTSLSQFINDTGYVIPSAVANAINTNTTTINGAKITTGSVSALQITTGSITATQIDVNSVQAATVTATKVNALNVVAGSVNAGWVYAGDIVANNITSGTLNVDRITSGSLTATNYYSGVFNIQYSANTLASFSYNNSIGASSLFTVNFTLTTAKIYAWTVQIAVNGTNIYINTFKGTYSLAVSYALPPGNNSYSVIIFRGNNGNGDNVNYNIAATHFKK